METVTCAETKNITTNEYKHRIGGTANTSGTANFYGEIGSITCYSDVKSAEDILIEEGLEVITAQDGMMALDILNKADEGPFDVILMDIQINLFLTGMGFDDFLTGQVISILQFPH